jgi:hypothetical protein
MRMSLFFYPTEVPPSPPDISKIIQLLVNKQLTVRRTTFSRRVSGRVMPAFGMPIEKGASRVGAVNISTTERTIMDPGQEDDNANNNKRMRMYSDFMGHAMSLLFDESVDDSAAAAALWLQKR